MKIFRIVEDVNRYQSFYLEDSQQVLSELYQFDCHPKAADWTPPSVFILHPKLRKGNFLRLFTGSLVVDAVAQQQLDDLIAKSGELLPLWHEDEPYFVVNVTSCINVLDHSRTEWVYGESGSRLYIKKYAFHTDRLTETPLFKIPETCRSEILIYEGLMDPEDELKGRVERLGLKGLCFEELWTDDD